MRNPFPGAVGGWQADPVSESRSDPNAVRDDQDRRLATVRALLAKAEATEFPDEAEAFFAKASDLIGRWAIDEAMIWAGTAASGREQPDELQLVLHAPYLPQKAVLVGAVAQAHGCRAVRIVGAKGMGTEIVSVIGFPTELRWVDTLVTSLLVQLTQAMLARCPTGVTPSQSASWRRSFIVGFAEEVGERLERDRASAAADRTAGGSAATDVAGSGGSGRTAAGVPDPEPSVELVLASRVDEVDADLRRRHPRLRSSWASSGRSATGRREGRRAGREASIARNGIGNRGRLGPG